MKNQNYLEELKQTLQEAKQELAQIPDYPRVALFDEDGELNEEAYEDSMQISWWRDQQRDFIYQLEMEIERVEYELDTEIAFLLNK
jgi:hypothetical protein